MAPHIQKARGRQRARKNEASKHTPVPIAIDKQASNQPTNQHQPTADTDATIGTTTIAQNNLPNPAPR